MNTPRLRDFIYIDEHLLHKFAEQIRDMFADSETREIEASLSLGGPSLKATKKVDRVPLKTIDKIHILETYLKVKNEIQLSRPIRTSHAPDYELPRFVVETTIATKIVLPIASNSTLQGLKHAALWVSDPDPALYVKEPYDWRGSFLYLSEFHWDRERGHTLSGVSALQLLINIIQGRDFWSVVGDRFEPFGRGRDLHPIDKLKEIGGVVIGKRKIRSLYRMKYFTNEQVYNYEGEERRVNDLFGYPLYISDET